jgi:cephalosporin hydroxylase
MSTLLEVCNRGTSKWGDSAWVFTDKNAIHSYIESYQKIINKYNNSLKILDIGISAGGSLWLWQNYCIENNIKYDIWGMDINPKYTVDKEFQKDLDNDSNIHTIWSSSSMLSSSYDSVPEGFDIIVDDGAHTLESQIEAFTLAWPKLAVNGTYVIEDIQNESTIPDIEKHIKSITPNSNIEIYLGKKNGRYDDILIIVTK